MNFSDDSRCFSVLVLGFLLVNFRNVMLFVIVCVGIIGVMGVMFGFCWVILFISVIRE